MSNQCPARGILIRDDSNAGDKEVGRRESSARKALPVCKPVPSPRPHRLHRGARQATGKSLSHPPNPSSLAPQKLHQEPRAPIPLTPYAVPPCLSHEPHRFLPGTTIFHTLVFSYSFMSLRPESQTSSLSNTQKGPHPG